MSKIKIYKIPTNNDGDLDLNKSLIKAKELGLKSRARIVSQAVSGCTPAIMGLGPVEATKKAFEIIEAGADSLMCQNWNLEWMAHLSKFRIPFQSHVGFIPRRTTWIGGIRSFGKTANEAAELFRDIKDIEKTGAWGIEVELVPENILEVITKHTSLVTISIGSGIAADAQFLFAEDILGQSKISFPRHAKKYKNFDKILSDIQKERIDAFKKYKTEVQKNKFPTKKHTISIKKIELNKFRKFLEQH